MDTTGLILTSEFCQHYSVSYTFITGLSEAGLIDVITIEENQYLRDEQLSELEKLVRLHTDMNINLEGIEAIANLLQQVRQLQDEIAALKQRLRLYE